MDLSLPAITPEMRSALAASGGAPIHILDPETQQIYLVTEQPIEITLDEEYIREKIEEGLADIAAGRVAPWDPERIKRLGREWLAAQEKNRNAWLPSIQPG